MTFYYLPDSIIREYSVVYLYMTSPRSHYVQLIYRAYQQSKREREREEDSFKLMLEAKFIMPGIKMIYTIHSLFCVLEFHMPVQDLKGLKRDFREILQRLV